MRNADFIHCEIRRGPIYFLPNVNFFDPLPLWSKLYFFEEIIRHTTCIKNSLVPNAHRTPHPLGRFVFTVIFNMCVKDRKLGKYYNETKSLK